MKKIFFSIVAIAAIAACSKSEVQYDQEVAISFAPVAQNVTKSVAGVGANGTYDSTFPTTQNLYIFANSQDQAADGTLSETWSTSYLVNAEFEYDRLSNNVYEGIEAYYWPNVKSLIFAGYSNACNVADIAEDSEVDFGANTITITGYTQNNADGYTKEGGVITLKPGANDLMWFPWDNLSYTKRSSAVPVTMKHACSWITIKVVGDDVTGSNWKLHELKINGLYHTGTATCGATEATWAVSGAASPETVFENEEGVTIAKGPAVAMENVANNMVVIPQVPTTLDVTYSFVAQSGERITEIKKDMTLKYNGDDKWISGKHYTYTIKITATEILIAPTVEEWVEGHNLNPVI